MLSLPTVTASVLPSPLRLAASPTLGTPVPGSPCRHFIGRIHDRARDAFRRRPAGDRAVLGRHPERHQRLPTVTPPHSESHYPPRRRRLARAQFGKQPVLTMQWVIVHARPVNSRCAIPAGQRAPEDRQRILAKLSQGHRTLTPP